MRKIQILFAMLLSIILAGPSSAAECPSIDAMQAAVAAVVGAGGGVSEMLDPEETQAYLAALNKEPPVSHFAADRLLYLAHIDGRVQLGLVVGTQICPVVGSIALSLHAKLLRLAREHRA